VLNEILMTLIKLWRKQRADVSTELRNVG